MAAKLSIMILWVVSLCGLVSGYHILEERIVTLKMGAMLSSETRARCHNPKEDSRHQIPYLSGTRSFICSQKAVSVSVSVLWHNPYFP
jgi:hypothetical protein